jgi:23S rRNA (cytosine1962-C5)-methyltransferase
VAENKLLMFENRLRKVYKHFAKIARKQNIACFRFYDHDMPEFPFVIENYNGAIHAAEYKRRHGMEFGSTLVKASLRK